MKKLVGCLVLVAATLAASAQWSNSPADVPAFNQSAPSHAVPPILSGAQLTGPNFAHPYQVTIYKMAAKIPNVLYQQPCYCRCDREMGHNSLHSCFSSLHGAACSTCMKEAMFTYQQTRLGRSPAQIRKGIEHGDFLKLDLDAAKMD